MRKDETSLFDFFFEFFVGIDSARHRFAMLECLLEDVVLYLFEKFGHIIGDTVKRSDVFSSVSRRMTSTVPFRCHELRWQDVREHL